MIALISQSFSAAAERVQNSGRKSRRRLYVLHWMVVSPSIRPSRKRVAALLGVSIFTLKKDIAYCRAQLQNACKSNALPPDAFENLISAIG